MNTTVMLGGFLESLWDFLWGILYGLIKFVLDIISMIENVWRSFIKFDFAISNGKVITDNTFLALFSSKSLGSIFFVMLLLASSGIAIACAVKAIKNMTLSATGQKTDENYLARGGGNLVRMVLIPIMIFAVLIIASGVGFAIDKTITSVNVKYNGGNTSQSMAQDIFSSAYTLNGEIANKTEEAQNYKFYNNALINEANLDREYVNKDMSNTEIVDIRKQATLLYESSLLMRDNGVVLFTNQFLNACDTEFDVSNKKNDKKDSKDYLFKKTKNELNDRFKNLVNTTVGSDASGARKYPPAEEVVNAGTSDEYTIYWKMQGVRNTIMSFYKQKPNSPDYEKNFEKHKITTTEGGVTKEEDDIKKWYADLFVCLNDFSAFLIGQDIDGTERNTFVDGEGDTINAYVLNTFQYKYSKNMNNNYYLGNNGIVLLVLVFGVMSMLLATVIIIAERLFTVLFLYILSPFMLTIGVYDDNKRWGIWLETMSAKLIGAIGLMVAMTAYFVFADWISSIVIITKNSMEGSILKAVIMLGGVSFAQKGGQLISSLISQNLGMQETFNNNGIRTLGHQLAQTGGRIGAMVLGTGQRGGGGGGGQPQKATAGRKIKGLAAAGFTLATGGIGGVMLAGIGAGRMASKGYNKAKMFGQKQGALNKEALKLVPKDDKNRSKLFDIVKGRYELNRLEKDNTKKSANTEATKRVETALGNIKNTTDNSVSVKKQ